MSRFIVSIVILLLAAGAASADLQRSVLELGEEGTALRVEHAPGEPAPASPPLRSDIVFWERHIPGLIYTSCSIGLDAYYGGTTNGDPAAVESLGGDGVPNWIWQGGANSVRGNAVVEDNPSIAGVTVRFEGDGEAWAWSVDIPNCSSYPRCIRHSFHGGLVAVAVNMSAGHAAVYCFDTADGTQVSAFETPAGQFARALRLTEDGDRAALRAGATIHVIDTATGAGLWSGSAAASADPLGFGPNGRWLVSGWSSLFVWEAVGDTYALRWLYNGGGSNWYLGTCAVDENGDLVAGWYRNDWRQSKVQMMNAEEGLPGVFYEGPVTDGIYQELPSASIMDGFTNLAVVGNWGDAGGLSPEILLFQFGNPVPVAKANTPGSIYDIDALGWITGRSTGLEMVACGKAVHANEFGSGGDYYNMFYGNTAAPAAPAGERLQLTAHPNPFNPSTSLRVTLAEAGSLRLDIYDTRGRRVRSLDTGERAAGVTSVSWDGRNDDGQPLSSGLYLARASNGTAVVSARLMLMK